MTKPFRDNLLTGIITGVTVGCVMLLLGGWVNKNRDISVTINDKLKSDIKIEVKEEIRIELDKKVSRELFDAHVVQQMKDDENMVMLLHEYTKHIDKRFDDIKELIKQTNRK